MSKMVSLWDDSGMFKWHAVPESLLLDLMQDLQTRDSQIALRQAQLPSVERDGESVVGLDLPGMCMMNRSYRSVQLDGVKVEVPSQDWESILYEVKLKPKRVFASGKEYYKIHHWVYCLVLTPAQRDALIAGMEAQLDAAEAEAVADNKRFMEGVRDINKDRVQVVSARAQALEQAAAGKKGEN